jgi:hypothetical protein
VRHVDVIENYRVVVCQRERLAVDSHGSGIEVRIEPDSNVRICPVLRDACVFAASEVSEHVLTARSILPPMKPTWATAPNDEKVERLLVACDVAAQGSDYCR